jgi:hypothetical protein
MTWNDLTVEQYQQLYPIVQNDNGLDMLVEVISILEGMAIDEIDSKPYKWLLDKEKEYEFLSDLNFDKTAKSFIDVNGKRYMFCHEIENMPAARYIESKVMSSNIAENLHKLIASCVYPMKKGLFGWKVQPYNVKDHAVYAEDMKKANFVDVYNNVVFFYHVLNDWIQSSQASMMKELEGKMTMEDSQRLVQILSEIMDGFTPSKGLQSTKELV